MTKPIDIDILIKEIQEDAESGKSLESLPNKYYALDDEFPGEIIEFDKINGTKIPVIIKNGKIIKKYD